MAEQTTDKKVIIADISLLLVALFWGSNFVVMKDALEVIAPFTYLGIRFSIAALLLAFIFWKRLRKAPTVDYLAGCLIGLFLFSGYGFQTIGLLHTTPANSGFITGTAVVIVPFLYFLIYRHSPGWWAFLGGGLAAVGLYLLSANEYMGFGFGDMLTLVSAFLFAAHLIAIAVYVRSRDPIVLAVVQIAFTGLASFGAALIFEPTDALFRHSLPIWGAILYAVIFCTIGAFVTQTLAQRYTPPTHAVLILSTEAVFAGLFSYLFWDEIFTVRKLFGAVLILTGILITELRPVIAAKLAARRAASIRRGLPPM
ncbi:MAG TPA: DMT family transporter [Firmicutes bacterium]|nr:DMT family transporter [Bacillota bacterium]